MPANEDRLMALLDRAAAGDRAAADAFHSLRAARSRAREALGKVGRATAWNLIRRTTEDEG
jgi:hypothetical protein